MTRSTRARCCRPKSRGDAIPGARGRRRRRVAAVLGPRAVGIPPVEAVRDAGSGHAVPGDRAGVVPEACGSGRSAQCPRSELRIVERSTPSERERQDIDCASDGPNELLVIVPVSEWIFAPMSSRPADRYRKLGQGFPIRIAELLVNFKPYPLVMGDRAGGGRVAGGERLHA